MDIEVRLELSGADLRRVTVLGAADPLTEVQSAAHRLAFGRAIDAPAANWARRTAAALGPTGALIMDVLGSGLAVCSDLGQHRERFAVEFDEFADAIRRVPPRDWGLEVDSLLDWGISPGRPAEMASDRARIDQFAAVIARFQDAAVRPYWAAISATVAAHSDAVARRLSMGNTSAVLNALHPAVTWDDPILTIRGDRGAMCAPHCAHRLIGQHVTHLPPQPLEGRGLVLLPSVLTTEVGVYAPEDSDADDRPWELAYPVPWNWSVMTDAHRNALADLLGATRARVLDSLLGRTLTTSELARCTHISPASASEHASVLRTAGLLSSSRTGSRVYHRLTPVGVALATGGSGVMFTGTAAEQIDTFGK